METISVEPDDFCLFVFKSYYVVWKRDCFAGWSEPDEKFKSYYVVWKQAWGIRNMAQTVCLNRTMQYGNKKHTKSLNLFLSWFKSYYVVWKLANMGRIIPIFVTFKSYYVVWKPV